MQWDILSNGGAVQEMAHIANGRDTGNCVSLLRVNVSSISIRFQTSDMIEVTMTDSNPSFLQLYAECELEPKQHADPPRELD